MDTDFMINAGTKSAVSNGIVGNHAYSVYGAYEVNGVKLFKLRNPWSKETYTGPYSDADAVWDSVSEAVKTEIGYTNSNDGFIFMPIAEFMTQYSNLNFVPDHNEFNARRFLKLGDS